MNSAKLNFNALPGTFRAFIRQYKDQGLGALLENFSWDELGQLKNSFDNFLNIRDDLGDSDNFEGLQIRLERLFMYYPIVQAFEKDINQMIGLTNYGDNTALKKKRIKPLIDCRALFDDDPEKIPELQNSLSETDITTLLHEWVDEDPEESWANDIRGFESDSIGNLAIHLVKANVRYNNFHLFYAMVKKQVVEILCILYPNIYTR